MTIELNRDNYEKETKNADLPIMVDFWGPLCGPCLALMPFVDRLEEEYRDKARIAKLNVTQNRMLCARLRVMGVPTFIFYKDGEEFKRLTGEPINENAIREVMDELLAG
jgi:thioredoxin 1